MNEAPSVLFVLPWNVSAVGGVNQVVINLAREMARHGRLRPIILSSNWESEGFEVADFGGIMHVTTRLRSPTGSGNAARELAAFALKMRGDMNAWRAFIRQHNIRVINAHYAFPGYLLFALMRALKRANYRLVYSLHGADVTQIIEAPQTTRATSRWMLRQADRVVCCSEDLSTHAINALKLYPDRVNTVYNAIDLQELDRARESVYRPPCGEFENYVINVATFEPKKGQDVLIDAYLQLVRNGLKSALVLVGRETPHLATLRNRVRKHGLQKHVFFVTDLDHVRTVAAIANARLLVQPSREEPFGITLLEAAYLRTPIVATRVGGIPEVLGNYYPHLVAPDDPEALAQAIDEALFNPTETQHQVRLQRRRVASRFSLGRVFEEYENVLLGRQ